MFLLNSCLGLFSAACLRRLPFLRTYGVNLPSSLTTLLPLVLGCSPHLPVSVFGTGTFFLNSSFSRQCGFCASVLVFPYASPFQIGKRTSQLSSLLGLHKLFQSLAHATSCVPASLNRKTVVQECLPVPHRLRLAALP